MNRKECRSTRREIEESELNQRLSDQTLAHVDSCITCREFHDERASLRNLVGSLDPVAAPGDFDLRLRARIAAERQRNAPGSFFTRFAVGTPAIAVAALIVILVASIVWFAQRAANHEATVASNSPGASGPAVVASSDQSANEKETSSTAAAETNPPITGLTALGASGRDRNLYRTVSGKSIATREAVGPATDLNVTGAESIRQGEVSLSAPVKPVVVSMQDNRGGKRKISLPPVSFGSQRLVDNRFPVTSNSRSW
jgi:hypothetical protein